MDDTTRNEQFTPRDPRDVAFFKMFDSAWKGLAEDALSVLSALESQKPGITGKQNDRFEALNERRRILALSALMPSVPQPGCVSDRTASNTDTTPKTASAASPALDQATWAYYGYDVDQNDIDSDSAEAAAIERIMATLTAAAAKAREDERARIAQRVSERCILRLQVECDPVKEANEIIQDLAHDIATNWADYADYEDEDSAIATPAPCNHHWIIGNDSVWCTKCNEERSATPAQSEGK